MGRRLEGKFEPLPSPADELTGRLEEAMPGATATGRQRGGREAMPDVFLPRAPGFGGYCG